MNIIGHRQRNPIDFGGYRVDSFSFVLFTGVQKEFLYITAYEVKL